jgi:hypothetical protein
MELGSIRNENCQYLVSKAGIIIVHLFTGKCNVDVTWVVSLIAWWVETTEWVPSAMLHSIRALLKRFILVKTVKLSVIYAVCRWGTFGEGLAEAERHAGVMT